MKFQKPLSIFLLFFTFLITGVAQELSIKDVKDLKTSHDINFIYRLTTHNSNGLLLADTRFDSGDLDGLLIYFDENGKILKEIRVGRTNSFESIVDLVKYENGYYLEPTVIEVPTDECRVNKEEIFGPVVTIMPFTKENEVLTMANKSDYGLSATLWTNNLKRAIKMTSQLQVGIVWVNTWMMRDLRTPFGGIKTSGIGREGGFEALRFFTEPKNVCIKY